jgi:TRAP-type C4-dicarboxylate transport system permease small subunit
MRAALDALYRLSGLVAGFFLVAMAALSLMQIVGRLLGYAAHSFDEFAGYAMAASSFLGLAWTFRANEHIRVTLAIERARGGLRRAVEIACLVAAIAIVGFFAWAAIDMTWTSYQLNDVSMGLVPIQLWIPQSGMALGLAIMVVALVDDLVVVARGAAASYERTAAAAAGALPSADR